MRKVLCPHCGTVSQIGLSPFATCPSCHKPLPITLPRAGMEVAVKLIRIGLLFALLAVFIVLAPSVQSLRHNQKVGESFHSVPINR